MRDTYGEVVMQNAAVATGNGTVAPCIIPGKCAWKWLTMQVEGITTATITFEGTVDETNWVAIGVTSLADNSTVATTATADNIVRVQVSGLKQVRARISAWTAGTITVTGILSKD